MSVLIKDMKMPDKCGQCPCFHHEYPTYCQAVCRSSNKYMTVGAPYGMPRPDWCPLVEVPAPHGRLIDERVAEQHIGYHMMGIVGRGGRSDWQRVHDGLADAQTVIEAEGEEHDER